MSDNNIHPPTAEGIRSAIKSVVETMTWLNTAITPQTRAEVFDAPADVSLFVEDFAEVCRLMESPFDQIREWADQVGEDCDAYRHDQHIGNAPVLRSAYFVSDHIGMSAWDAIVLHRRLQHIAEKLSHLYRDAES